MNPGYTTIYDCNECKPGGKVGANFSENEGVWARSEVGSLQFPVTKSRRPELQYGHLGAMLRHGLDFHVEGQRWYVLAWFERSGGIQATE